MQLMGLGGGGDDDKGEGIGEFILNISRFCRVFDLCSLARCQQTSFQRKPYKEGPRYWILLDSPLGGVCMLVCVNWVVSSCKIRPNVVCIADN